MSYKDTRNRQSTWAEQVTSGVSTESDERGRNAGRPSSSSSSRSSGGGSLRAAGVLSGRLSPPLCGPFIRLVPLTPFVGREPERLGLDLGLAERDVTRKLALRSNGPRKSPIAVPRC